MNGCRGNCLLQWNLAVAETLMETNTERSLSLSNGQILLSPSNRGSHSPLLSASLFSLSLSPSVTFFPPIVTLSIPLSLRLSTCPLPLSHCFTKILPHFRKKKKKKDAENVTERKSKRVRIWDRQHALSYFHYFNSVDLRFGSFAHLFHTQQRDRERDRGVGFSSVLHARAQNEAHKNAEHKTNQHYFTPPQTYWAFTLPPKLPILLLLTTKLTVSSDSWM